MRHIKVSDLSPAEYAGMREMIDEKIEALEAQVAVQDLHVDAVLDELAMVREMREVFIQEWRIANMRVA